MAKAMHIAHSERLFWSFEAASTHNRSLLYLLVHCTGMELLVIYLTKDLSL
jgi:hypothetical protein